MKAKVLIGLPSQEGHFHPNMTLSLDRLIQYTGKKHPEMGLAVRKEFGTLIFDNRNRLVRKAYEIKATHLLFIDSDMVFDEDALLQLLAHDRDIVSGLCTQRGEPYTPVAKRRDENNRWVNAKGLEDGRFYSDLDGVGCAFTLIKMKVFDVVEEPWFCMPPCDMVDNYRVVLKAEKGLRLALRELVQVGKDVPPDKLEGLLKTYEWDDMRHGHPGYVLGEDIYFCDKARHAGIKVCLDASLIIGHIGEHAYTIEDYVEYKRQREANESAA